MHIGDPRAFLPCVQQRISGMRVVLKSSQNNSARFNAKLCAPCADVKVSPGVALPVVGMALQLLGCPTSPLADAHASRLLAAEQSA